MAHPEGAKRAAAKAAAEAMRPSKEEQQAEVAKIAEDVRQEEAQEVGADWAAEVESSPVMQEKKKKEEAKKAAAEALQKVDWGKTAGAKEDVLVPKSEGTGTIVSETKPEKAPSNEASVVVELTPEMQADFDAAMAGANKAIDALGENKQELSDNELLKRQNETFENLSSNFLKADNAERRKILERSAEFLKQGNAEAPARMVHEAFQNMGEYYMNQEISDAAARSLEDLRSKFATGTPEQQIKMVEDSKEFLEQAKGQARGDALAVHEAFLNHAEVFADHIKTWKEWDEKSKAEKDAQVESFQDESTWEGISPETAKAAAEASEISPDEGDWKEKWPNVEDDPAYKSNIAQFDSWSADEKKAHIKEFQRFLVDPTVTERARRNIEAVLKHAGQDIQNWTFTLDRGSGEVIRPETIDKDPLYKQYQKALDLMDPQGRGEWLQTMKDKLKNHPDRFDDRSRAVIEAMLGADADMGESEPVIELGDMGLDEDMAAERAARTTVEAAEQPTTAPATERQAPATREAPTADMERAAAGLGLSIEQMNDLKKSFDYMMKELDKPENAALKRELVGDGKLVDFTWTEFMQARTKPKKKKGLWGKIRTFGKKFEVSEMDTDVGMSKQEMWERMAEAYTEFSRGISGRSADEARESIKKVTESANDNQEPPQQRAA